jgi:hypothetical protein
MAKMTTFKEFVDFAFSLREMEEVKVNKFPLPKSLTYILSKNNHESLQREVLAEKKMSVTELSDEFDIVLYGINFKFTQ